MDGKHFMHFRVKNAVFKFRPLMRCIFFFLLISVPRIQLVSQLFTRGLS